MLTNEQKAEVALIASVGCDRETAAMYVGCRLDELNDALRADAGFADQVRRAEAGCELAHMRCVQQASRDERHWRASVWWLERHRPARYARTDSDAVSKNQLVRFAGALAYDLAEVLDDEHQRAKALESITRVVRGMGDPLRIELHASDKTVEEVTP